MKRVIASIGISGFLAVGGTAAVAQPVCSPADYFMAQGALPRVNLDRATAVSLAYQLSQRRYESVVRRNPPFTIFGVLVDTDKLNEPDKGYGAFRSRAKGELSQFVSPSKPGEPISNDDFEVSSRAYASRALFWPEPQGNPPPPATPAPLKEYLLCLWNSGTKPPATVKPVTAVTGFVDGNVSIRILDRPRGAISVLVAAVDAANVANLAEINGQLTRRPSINPTTGESLRDITVKQEKKENEKGQKLYSSLTVKIGTGDKRTGVVTVTIPPPPNKYSRTKLCRIGYSDIEDPDNDLTLQLPDHLGVGDCLRFAGDSRGTHARLGCRIASGPNSQDYWAKDRIILRRGAKVTGATEPNGPKEKENCGWD